MASPQQRLESSERYRQNTVRAQIADLFGLMTGAETDLVSYDDVAKRLKARQQIEMGTQMVPLEQIVGSVGRYRDFTRTFLPRTGINQERWSRIDAALNSLESLPPVELYKIGEVYFVRDGNHRVSVARANGLSHIEAYVSEVQTDTPLTLDDFERDQWLIKAERTEFLAETHFDQLCPDNNIYFTEPGRYAILKQHIQVHHYLRGKDQEQAGDKHPFTWDEAVKSWYHTIYLPVIEAIRGHELLKDFPNRSEADLYLWVVFQRERLSQHYHLAPLRAETAVTTFAELHSDHWLNRIYKGMRANVLHILGIDEIPLGMSEEEFLDLRARHDAGERSLAEAEGQDHTATILLTHKDE